MEPFTAGGGEHGGYVGEVLGVFGTGGAGLEEEDYFGGEGRQAVRGGQRDLVERLAEGAAAAVVDPLVGLGRSEDDADRRRELVVRKGQDVRARGQGLARFPDAELAGRGVLERRSGCGEGRGYLVEV